ncbi:hypothetical protein GCM10023080_031510 [Streptomyces pseudoechinosporeus]
MPRQSSKGAVPWPGEYARRYADKGCWEGHAIGSGLHAVANAASDAVALVDGEHRLTYRQLAERAHSLVVARSGLRGRGPRPSPGRAASSVEWHRPGPGWW